MEQVIGLDVGGTKIAAAVITSQGIIREILRLPTRAQEGPDALIERLIDVSARLRERHPAVEAIGVASAGQIDHRLGTVVYANENLPGWTGMPIAERLRGALSLPVWVDNDVRSIALAEAHWGAGRGSRALLVAAIGTGVGGALVVDGQVFRGATNGAGEIGHIPVTAAGPLCACGNRGCLEVYAGGPRIAAAYARATGGAPVDLQDVAAAAYRGDLAAVAAFARAGRMAGRALAGIANTLDPDMLVIGGGVAEAGEVLFAPLRDSLMRHLLPPLKRRLAVHPSALGPNAGALGAALVALQRGGTEPSGLRGR